MSFGLVRQKTIKRSEIIVSIPAVENVDYWCPDCKDG